MKPVILNSLNKLKSEYNIESEEYKKEEERFLLLNSKINNKCIKEEVKNIKIKEFDIMDKIFKYECEKDKRVLIVNKIRENFEDGLCRRLNNYIKNNKYYYNIEKGLIKNLLNEYSKYKNEKIFDSLYLIYLYIPKYQKLIRKSINNIKIFK